MIRGGVVGRRPRRGPAHDAGRMVPVLAIGAFVFGIHTIGCRAGRDGADETRTPSSNASASGEGSSSSSPSAEGASRTPPQTAKEGSSTPGTEGTASSTFPPDSSGGGSSGDGQGREAQEQVVVRAGGEPRASASGITIRFLKVLEDSRCPVDVQCVWAGNARLALELSSKERPAAVPVELNTLRNPRSIAFAGRTIEIERLSPARRTGSEIAPTDYEAVLRVGSSPSS